MLISRRNILEAAVTVPLISAVVQAKAAEMATPAPLDLSGVKTVRQLVVGQFEKS